MSDVLRENGDDSIDLDDLSTNEFLTDEESDYDNDNMFAVAEELDMFGQVGKDRKRKKDEEPDEEINEPTNKSMRSGTVDADTQEEKVALGALFKSVKDMRKAAKLNLRAMTRLGDLIEKYPNMAFLKKLLKPVAEIMPDEPINTVQNLISFSGSAYVAGPEKYPTGPVMKVIPKKQVIHGKISHRCSADGCDFSAASWGKVKTHINLVHLGQSYQCPVCGKVLTSLDGFRGHLKNQHDIIRQ